MSELNSNANAQSNSSQDSSAASQKNSKLRTIDDLLLLLKGVKPERNGQYSALCPAHDDHNRSLSIGQDNGKLLIKCFAGCEVVDILKPLGLDISDLFLSNNSVPQRKPPKTLEATFSYESEKGKESYQIRRYEPKDFRAYRLENGKYVPGLGKQQPILYKLPQIKDSIQQGQTIYIPEGEGKVDLLISIGLAATTSPFGAGRGKWHPEYSDCLIGADVVILPDNDTPGQSFANEKANALLAKAKTVKLLQLPNLPPKGDIKDWVNNGGTAAELEALVAKCPLYQVSPIKKTSQGRRLVDLALSQNIMLFKDQQAEACARINVNGHFENWRLESKNFKHYLGSLMYKKGESPTPDTIKSAILALTGEALFGSQSETYPLYNRVAWLDGAIYYDLSDPAWRAVKITPEGWEIIDNPPILFRRYKHQKAQVEPVKGGDPKLLFALVRIPSELQILLLAWCISCIIPDIPHVIPIFHGSEGTAKSWSCYVLRSLIDPSIQRQLSLGGQQRELIQTLDHVWCPIFDNEDYLSNWQANCLCRASTGDGFSKRELYSDDDDYIYTFKRCVGLNGINIMVNRPDFLDRVILINMNAIPDDERLTEAQLEENLVKQKPQILGALFDVLVKAMAIKPRVKLTALPRMADFAEWGYAIAEALRWGGQQFLDAYQLNIKNRQKTILDADVVATVLINFMENQMSWEDDATELLKLLTAEATGMGINTKAKAFPKLPNALSGQLNRLKTTLAKNGILIEHLENIGEANLKKIRITKNSNIEETSSLSTTSTTDTETIRDDVDDELLSLEKASVNRETSESLQQNLQQTDTKKCPVCGSTNWWQRPDGEWVCGTCHPKPDENGKPRIDVPDDF
jgi:hypothetical protein